MIIGEGTNIESTERNSILEALGLLPNNTTKQINPKDVRDAVYTTWQNITLKPTTVAGSSEVYIGIDQTDIKHKMFFGKRQNSGADIMTPAMLLSDVDHFFYNNRADGVDIASTKIAIMAGTNSAVNFLGTAIQAPYLQSTPISDGSGGTYIDFSIVNSSFTTESGTTASGSINILSQYGAVTINNLSFPTAEVVGNPSNNGKILKYNDGKVIFSDPAESSVTAFETLGNFYITASSVLINGYPLEFTNTTPMPVAVGSFPIGTTFNKMPIVKVLEGILYNYFKPTVSINAIQPLIEVGSNINGININYSIKQTSTTASITNVVLNNISPAAITALEFRNLYPTGGLYSTYSTGIFTDINTSGIQEWNIQVTDSNSTLVSATTSATKIYPIFYGTASTWESTTDGIINVLRSSSVTKLLEGKGTKSLQFAGKNVCMYFAYPDSYLDLTDIIDPNGFSQIGTFTKYPVSFTSPNNFWTGINYNVYVYEGNPIGGNLTTPGLSPMYRSTYTFVF
jgi:hypothetical protein